VTNLRANALTTPFGPRRRWRDDVGAPGSDDRRQDGSLVRGRGSVGSRPGRYEVRTSFQPTYGKLAKAGSAHLRWALTEAAVRTHSRETDPPSPRTTQWGAPDSLTSHGACARAREVCAARRLARQLGGRRLLAVADACAHRRRASRRGTPRVCAARVDRLSAAPRRAGPGTCSGRAAPRDDAD
jgi:hypothetical protein